MVQMKDNKVLKERGNGRNGKINGEVYMIPDLHILLGSE